MEKLIGQDRKDTKRNSKHSNW